MEDYILQDTEFRLFRDLIYRLTGIALADGKRQLVKSRLTKRLRYYHLERFQDYYDLVMAQGESGPETTEMVNCITTNKTDFFREPHHFQFVGNKLLQEKIQQARWGQVPRRLRVWHAGCSTGEEPYTLAMTLAEALQGEGHWDVRQLASDIDTDVLAHAARGIYEMERVDPVPEPLLKKYFLRGQGEQSGFVKVRDELRQQITFKQINLLDSLWPIRHDVRFDMIFCRNVVIYFDKPTQRRLFARFQEWLRPGGYLFIGHSESLLGISDAFESLGQTIYRLPEMPIMEAVAA
jgi:chemotaxis protein methyltransferase CheR